jgi:hypothetical protein
VARDFAGPPSPNSDRCCTHHDARITDRTRAQSRTRGSTAEAHARWVVRASRITHRDVPGGLGVLRDAGLFSRLYRLVEHASRHRCGRCVVRPSRATTHASCITIPASRIKGVLRSSIRRFDRRGACEMDGACITHRDISGLWGFTGRRSIRLLALARGARIAHHYGRCEVQTSCTMTHAPCITRLAASIEARA